MKKKKRISLRVPASALLAAAGLLFAGSAVGSTRAALSIYSEEYRTALEVPELDVALERGDGGGYQAVEGDALLGDAGEEGSEAVIGKTYGEALRVSNTGSLESYVRVRIYRFWSDGAGKPIRSLAPELIGLDLTEGNGWAVGEESGESEEMTVLYYMKPLGPGESTPDFMTGYRISSDVWKKTDETGYAYAGRRDETGALYDPAFKLEVEVDAVQTVGGSEAVMSAWGRSMTVAPDGTLSFGGYRGSGWDAAEDVSGNDVGSAEENRETENR